MNKNYNHKIRYFKYLLIIILFVIELGIVNGQDEKIYKINIGPGFLPTIYPKEAEIKTILIGFTFDFNIGKKFNIGANLHFTNGSITGGTQSSFTEKYSFLIIGVRCNYSLIYKNKFELYCGSMIGKNHKFYSTVSAHYITEDDLPQPKSGSYSIYVGSRYYIKDKIGLFTEIGYGYSLINCGLVLNIIK
ncbi:MAG: hypothetical protein KAT68_19075 [Bacteroidales bacterium]|nr:hypothetical protein [Bacteroidales bacterium]